MLRVLAAKDDAIFMIEIIPEKTSKGFLQFKGTDEWMRGYAKWDGCVEIDFVPGDGDEMQYSVHICDLPMFIARLQAIQTEAKKHFGEDWE